MLFAGFFPALTEEFLSRAFSIPFLQNVFRSRLFAIVLAGFIWGFGHSTYPNQPFWIRGVEVGLVGVVAGFLMERELSYLGAALENPKRPFVAVLGGAKISGKIDLIEALLPKVDTILVGGAMACTFFKAMGLEVGNSLVEPDRLRS